MHLYAFHLPEAPLPDPVYDALSSHLKPEARDRLKRFRLPEDALRSLVGRLAIIWYLKARQLLPSSEEPIFDKKGKGKPILVRPQLDPPLVYNTSHEGSYVLLGIARGREADIGVDLMRIPDSPRDIQEGISDQLTLREKQALAGVISDVDLARLITLLWTLKEGYVKAIGDGIVFGMERIEVTLDINRCEAVSITVDGVDAKQRGWDWSNGWIGEYGWTVFWKGEEPEGRANIEHVSWNDFIDPFV